MATRKKQSKKGPGHRLLRSLAEKQRALKDLERMPKYKVCEIHGCSGTTLDRWVFDDEHGQLAGDDPTSRRAGRNKFKEEDRRRIIDALRNRGSRTFAEICAENDVSTLTARKWLKHPELLGVEEDEEQEEQEQDEAAVTNGDARQGVLPYQRVPPLKLRPEEDEEEPLYENGHQTATSGRLLGSASVQTTVAPPQQNAPSIDAIIQKLKADIATLEAMKARYRTIGQ